MKTMVKVNVLTEEITMTKATAQKARSIGSKEYEQLARVKKDFPDFTVKILSPKVKESSNKGLTMPLMEKLVRGMTNNSQATIEKFESVKESYKGTNFHFSKPKAYFLSEYPTWREWLPEVEERQAAQAQAEPVTAVEEHRARWVLGKTI